MSKRALNLFFVILSAVWFPLQAQENNLLPYVYDISFADGIAGERNITSILLSETLDAARVIQDDDGTLYAIEPAYGNIRRIDASGNADFFVTGLSFPMGIVKASDGNFYVSELYGGSIKRVTPDGSVSSLFQGMAFFDIIQAQDGNFYALSPTAIIKIDIDGNASLFKEGFKNPISIAEDYNGDFYITETEAGNIWSVSKWGFSMIAKRGLSSPVSIAIDKSGIKYITTDLGIQIIYPNRSEITIADEVSSGQGISIGKDGDLYVTVPIRNQVWKVSTTYTLTLSEHTPSGTLIGTVDAYDGNSEELTYSIVSGNETNAFSVGSTSGVLSIANSRLLDYETRQHFPLVINISDGSDNTQVTLDIKLTDIPEVPMITGIRKRFQTFDQSRQTITRLINALSNADDVVQAYDGNFYALEPSAKRITQITPEGKTSVFVDGINGLTDITVGNDGSIYVTADGDIQRIDRNGKMSIYAEINDLTIQKIVQATDSSFYISRYYPSNIERLSPDGELSTLIPTSQSPPPASDIIQGVDRSLYIIDSHYEGGSLIRIEADSSLSTVANNLGNVRKAVQGMDGSWYLTSGYNLKKIDPSGVVSVYMNNGHPPLGLTFGQDGHLYVITRQALWKVAMNLRFAIRANLMNGAAIAQVESQDPNEDKLTYQITTGNDAGIFTIDASGNIRVADSIALSKAGENIYTLGVVANDGFHTSPEVQVTIQVIAQHIYSPVITGIIAADSKAAITEEKIDKLIQADAEVESFAFDNYGNTYMIVDISETSEDYYLRKVSASGQVTEFKNIKRPLYVVSGPDNNIYVSADSKIIRIEPDGSQSVIVDKDGWCVSMTFGVDECIYCALSIDGEKGLVRKITLDGEVSVFAEGFSYPSGIASGPEGSFYISELFTDKIKKIAPDGTVTIFLDQRPNTKDLLYSSDDHLYLSSSEGTISKFSLLKESAIVAREVSYPGRIVLGSDNTLYVGTFEGISTINRMYRVSINTPIIEGMNVCKIEAVDLADLPLKYADITENSDGKFAVNASDGTITVANATNLNNKTDFSYTLEVSVSNQFRSTKEIIEVLVNPRNEITSVNNEITDNHTLKVFPNPTAGQLQVQINLAKASELIIEISTISGKTLYRRSYTATDYFDKSIDLSNMSEGIYMLTVYSEQDVFVKPVIVQ